MIALILVSAFLPLCSCNKSPQTNELKRIVKERMGKRIIIPNNLYFVNSTDSVINVSMSHHYKYKLINYVDGDCGECISELFKWQVLINENSNLFGNTRLYFVIYSGNYPRFEYFTDKANINLPYYYDSTNQYLATNELEDGILNTLLIDHNNRVVLIGSPIENNSMEELYRKVLSE